MIYGVYCATICHTIVYRSNDLWCVLCDYMSHCIVYRSNDLWCVLCDYMSHYIVYRGGVQGELWGTLGKSPGFSEVPQKKVPQNSPKFPKIPQKNPSKFHIITKSISYQKYNSVYSTLFSIA